jgi:phospholipid transport system substrate-binding protein
VENRRYTNLDDKAKTNTKESRQPMSRIAQCVAAEPASAPHGDKVAWPVRLRFKKHQRATSCPRPLGAGHQRDFAASLTRGVLSAAFGLLIAAGSPLAGPANAEGNDAVGFMTDLLNRAIDVLNDKLPLADREQRFRQLFEADFDGPGIACFVLGLYWRQASSVEQEQFLHVFENYVVLVYSTRLADFSGESFKVSDSRADEDGAIVSTDVITPGRAPLKIDWRLVTDKGSFKIRDVIVDGVSMMVNERAEFASVIQRHGADVDGLLVLMREKIASAASVQ